MDCDRCKTDAATDVREVDGRMLCLDECAFYCERCHRWRSIDDRSECLTWEECRSCHDPDPCDPCLRGHR